MSTRPAGDASLVNPALLAAFRGSFAGLPDGSLLEQRDAWELRMRLREGNERRVNKARVALDVIDAEIAARRSRSSDANLSEISSQLGA